MDSFRNEKNYLRSIGLLLPAAVFLFVLAGLPSAGNAADHAVVGGIVERVSGTDVTLGAGTYDIGHARLLSVSGLELPPSELARGRKVDLLFKKGKVATVVIYPAVMIE